MSATVLPGRPAVARRSGLDAKAATALSAAARLWFVVTVTGQWIFAAYVAALYGGDVVRGDLGAQLVFAVVLNVGGPLQLWIRMWRPRL